MCKGTFCSKFAWFLQLPIPAYFGLKFLLEITLGCYVESWSNSFNFLLSRNERHRIKFYLIIIFMIIDLGFCMSTKTITLILWNAINRIINITCTTDVALLTKFLIWRICISTWISMFRIVQCIRIVYRGKLEAFSPVVIAYIVIMVKTFVKIISLPVVFASVSLFW